MELSKKLKKHRQILKKLKKSLRENESLYIKNNDLLIENERLKNLNKKLDFQIRSLQREIIRRNLEEKEIIKCNT